MAIDVYLYIDGIKGESADDTHKDWIECQSVNWGVSQPKSATASTGGGHTAERCEHADITITKLADLASPILLQTCAAGKTIPKAKFEFMRADAQGQRVKYYEIEIENVLIGSVAPEVEGGRHPGRGSRLQVLQGALEVHPTKNQRRRGRQHVRRLGPGEQPHRLIFRLHCLMCKVSAVLLHWGRGYFFGRAPA